MVYRVISWCVSILIMVDISCMIYFNAVQIFAKRKCRKKQYSKPFNACHESDCKFAEYCQHYEYVCTEEEMASLKKLVEDIRRKQQ